MEQDPGFDLAAAAARLGRSEEWVRSMVVDRRGDGRDAAMVTTGLHAVLGAGRHHRVDGAGGLVELGAGPDGVATDDTLVIDLAPGVHGGGPDRPPPHRSILARWGSGRRDGLGHNLLGGSVQLETDGHDEELSIPLVDATTDGAAAGLGYYGAVAIGGGETVRVDGPDFPVWLVDYGERYVDQYLLTGEGGGFYLEWHTDRPHWHQPLSTDAAGFYVLGRQVGTSVDGRGRYHLTAFRIPPGTAVLTRPGAIHCDAALTGTWAVGYGDSAHYSTALVRNQAGAMVRFVADGP